MSVLPPKAEDAVLAVTQSIIIDAPVDKVWGILLDFPSYPEWNSFVRSQVVVDSTNNPLPDQVAKEGSFLLMKTNIPPSMSKPGWFSQTAHEVVTVLDPDNHRVAWANRLPKWLLAAQRWQWLTPLEGDKTKYETIEVFNGPLAYLVKLFVAGGLRRSTRAMAEDLKARAENQQS